jgi:hypothetical protein
MLMAAQFVLIVERAVTVQIPQFVRAVIELPVTYGPPGSLGDTSQVTDPQVFVKVKLEVSQTQIVFDGSTISTFTT